MPPARPARRMKIFWPNVGSISHYPRSTREILLRIGPSKVSRHELNAWLCEHFDVTEEFARKLLNVLGASGILQSDRDGYALSHAAQEYLNSENADLLFNLFADRVLGFAELVMLLEKLGPAPLRQIEAAWEEQMSPMRFAKNQCPIRYNWLRGFGYASLVAHQLILTEKGVRFASRLKVSHVQNEKQQAQISHEDLEEKVRVIGEFFEFEAKKRPSVTEALPTYALKFRHGDRQLDCLWVRYIPFAGKIKFPIEIQLGGSIADAIDRLETVAQFVKRAIIVTTEDQEKQIMDRLEVKKSPLLGKLTIILTDDIYKAVEATSVLQSLAKRIFID
jgi:hypothetical protein